MIYSVRELISPAMRILPKLGEKCLAAIGRRPEVGVVSAYAEHSKVLGKSNEYVPVYFDKTLQVPGLPGPSLQNRKYLSAIVEHFCPKAPNPDTQSMHQLVGHIVRNPEASAYFCKTHIPLYPATLEMMNPGSVRKLEKQQRADMTEWKRSAPRTQLLLPSSTSPSLS